MNGAEKPVPDGTGFVIVLSVLRTEILSAVTQCRIRTAPAASTTGGLTCLFILSDARNDKCHHKYKNYRRNYRAEIFGEKFSHKYPPLERSCFGFYADIGS